MQVMNHDIVGLYDRLNRFIKEAQLSQSANISGVKKSDLIRLKTYLSSSRVYHTYVAKEPELDLPETNPKTWTLDAPPQLRRIENESLKDVCRLLTLCCEELVHSQSARLSAGILKFDSERFLAVLSKAENFLKDYVEKATPLDLPETSPKEPTTPAGRLGIGGDSE